MKILTIGSGDMWGKNNSASYLINDDILIDIPNGTCRELRKMDVNPSSIKHIVLTHLHADHYFDLPFYLLGRGNEESIIYCHENDKNKIIQLINLSFPNALSYINLSFNTSDEFEINNLYFKRVEVNHGSDIKAYGYIVDNNNYKLGFSGDSSLCDQIEYMSRICDSVILDCTLVNGNDKHMGIDNLLYLDDKYDTNIYATHLRDETRRAIEEEHLNSLKDGQVLVFKKSFGEK